MREAKTKVIFVRVTPEEYKQIEKVVRETGGTISEFMRVCLNRELALQGDPEGAKLLISMFTKGMQETLKRRVMAEMKRAKGKL